MSRYFSMTIMTSAIRMLSAATSSISPMVTMVTAFSMRSALKIWRFCSIQVVAASFGPTMRSAAWATSGARSRSSIFNSMAFTTSCRPRILCADSREVKAQAESRSKKPVSKVPTTRNSLRWEPGRTASALPAG